MTRYWLKLRYMFLFKVLGGTRKYFLKSCQLTELFDLSAENKRDILCILNTSSYGIISAYKFNVIVLCHSNVLICKF